MGEKIEFIVNVVCQTRLKIQSEYLNYLKSFFKPIRAEKMDVFYVNSPVLLSCLSLINL